MSTTVQVVGGLGDATDSDVLSGVTYTSDNGIKSTGTLVPVTQDDLANYVTTDGGGTITTSGDDLTGPLTIEFIDDVEDTGIVTTFNDRTGAVQPASGDYTAEMVGASPSVHASQHAINGSDPITIADVGGVNPNLLHNWYFGNCVNQRGKTSYVGSGYSIDRWYSIGNTVTIEDGYINLTNPQNYVAAFRQALENPKQFARKTVTVTALVVEGNPYIQLMKGSGLNSDIVHLGNVQGYPGLISFSVDIPEDAINDTYTYLSVGISIPVGSSAKIKAVKLELGSQQTLAHQAADGNWMLNEIPNYGEQLARCQRYCQVLSPITGYAIYGIGVINSTTTARIFVPSPISLRTYPSVSYSGGLEILNGISVWDVAGITRETTSPNGISLIVTVDATLTAGQSVMLRSDSATPGTIIISADL